MGGRERGQQDTLPRSLMVPEQPDLEDSHGCFGPSGLTGRLVFLPGRKTQRWWLSGKQTSEVEGRRGFGYSRPSESQAFFFYLTQVWRLLPLSSSGFSCPNGAEPLPSQGCKFILRVPIITGERYPDWAWPLGNPEHVEVLSCYLPGVMGGCHRL